MDDEDLIRRTIAEYSHRCDDGRFDELCDLFTEDARLLGPGTVSEGREAIFGYFPANSAPMWRRKLSSRS